MTDANFDVLEFDRLYHALIRIKTSLSSIKTDSDVILELASNCSLGINTRESIDPYSRALYMISLKDSGELDALRAEIKNPTTIPDV